jgi:ankyrin repeat protein
VGDLLLSRGAGGLTLSVAAGLGKLRAVQTMIKSGAALAGQRGNSVPATSGDHWPDDSAHVRGDVISDAMYAAARNGHTKVVEFLLDNGADVDAKGVFGGTALHWAAINGHRQTIELLVARGARVDIHDARFHATPAEWAYEGGYAEIATRLASAVR